MVRCTVVATAVSFDVVPVAVVNFYLWELEFTIGRSEPEKQTGGYYWSNS